MATSRKVDISVDEKLFKTLLREQQYRCTREIADKAFQNWKKTHAATIYAEATKYLDKEFPKILAKELPKLAKGFYCGFD